MEECIFSSYYGDECKGNELSQNRDHKRIESIISASEKRNDKLHEKLAPSLEADKNVKVKFHYTCVSRYCSTKSLEKVKLLPTKRRRSDETPFILKQDCLYCGLQCNL